MEETVKVKLAVDRHLLDKARQKFEETKGLTYTGLVDFLIRKAMKEVS